jgi:hypothetical protein
MGPPLVQFETLTAIRVAYTVRIFFFSCNTFFGNAISRTAYYTRNVSTVTIAVGILRWLNEIRTPDGAASEVDVIYINSAIF